MTLAVTDALLGAERVGVRCADGAIEALGADVAAQRWRRGDRRGRRAPGAAAGQRPHPRGDDALPRLRRRPAADAVAGRADLAGRGEARRRGRLLGRPPRLRGDDPQRHDPLLGHVLAAGGDGAGGRGSRYPRHDRGAALRPPRQPRASCGRRPCAASRRSPSCGPRITPALAPHAIYTVSEESLRWIGELSAERGLPVQIHLSETEKEVQDCLAEHGVRPAFYLDRLGLLERAHGPRPRRLARPRGAGADRRARRHRRHQPGGEHEARGRRRLPLPGGARRRRRGRARHRRRRLQRLARPARRPQGLRPRPEARRGDPTAIDAAEAWAVATGARAPRLGADPARARRPRRLPPPRAATRRSWASATSPPTSSTPPAGAVVDTTVVAGRVLMRGGEIEGLEEIVARAAERARRLGL